MTDFFRKHKIVVIIFALALIARAALFFINLDANGGNFEETVHGSDWYFEVAKNLEAGEGFAIFAGEPSAIHVPLYPLFLFFSLFLFGNFAFAVVVQVIIGSIIPVLGKIVAFKIVPSEKISLLVGFFLALEPNFVLFSSIFFTETLFIFIFLLFFIAFLTYFKNTDARFLALSALLLGMATLIKTVTQFLPIILLPLLWWFVRKKLPIKTVFLHFGLFAVVFVLVLSPWLYRNYKVFGAPGMTIMPTLNLYATLVPSVLSVENGTSFNEARDAFLKQTGVDLKTLTFANASDFNKEAFGELWQNKLSFIKVSAVNIFTFFTHDGMLTVLENAGITPERYLSRSALELFFFSPVQFAKTVYQYIFSPFVLVLVMRLFWLLVTALFLVGTILLLRRKMFTVSVALSLATVLYFAGTTPSNGLTVNARFRMPVYPIILTIALYSVFERKRQKDDYSSLNPVSTK
ncbi:MAG: glycosyltransferase family 39 protein [bacterium]|nr:glycosyltransferase family 39 protein [bacterium]